MDTVPHSALSDNFTVYSLIDPRDNAIRYIGITYDVYQRMRQHSRCAGYNEAKNAWIQELQNEQLMFIMHSLEKVRTIEQALEREAYWIVYYLEQGAKLFNIAGVANPVPLNPPKQASKPRVIRNIPIHVDPWELCDYPIAKRNNQLVTVEHSTPEEFQAWLDWNNIDESTTEELEWEYVRKGLGWTFEYRYLVINHALNQGISLNLADGFVIELFLGKIAVYSSGGRSMT